MMNKYAIIAIIFLLIGLLPAVAAQEDTSTFGDAMRVIAEELDASAEQALSAMSEEAYDHAVNRMDYLLEQVILLDQPVSTQACQLKSLLTQWANFQVRAFRNYPDRTYDYLYHDTRTQFLDMLDALPTESAEQPYTLTIAIDQAAPVAATEPDDSAPLTVVASWQFPGWDSTGIQYSPDGRYLIRLGSQNSGIIDLEATEDALRISTDVTMDANFSDDPLVMAAIEPGVGVTIWDTTTWDVLTILPTEMLITEVAITTDGGIIAGGGDAGVIIWQYLQQQRLLTNSVIHGLAFSPDGQYLAAGVVRGDDVPPGVVVYDTRTWEIVQQWEADQSAGETVVNELVFNLDSSQLAVVCSRTGVCLYDIISGERIAQMPESVFARDAAFSADGQWLAVVGGEYLHIYDINTASLVYQQAANSQDAYLGVAFHPDGDQFAMTTVQGVVIYAMPPLD